MSKRAEERALEILPPRWRKTKDGKGKVDSVLPVRKFYIRAYEQAEKDLGWISVKDRLPKSDGYYFTCSDDNGHVQCVGVTKFDSATCQWLDDDDDDDDYINVDYWMDVPQLK